MAKATPAKKSKKLSLNKKTVKVLNNRSIVANLQDTKRPIIIITMGCGTDITKQLTADLKKILMTDFTKPVK